MSPDPAPFDALPAGWYPATDEDEGLLHAELQRELIVGHLLFGLRVRVVAHRDGATDDILCQHVDEPNRFTVVHLTWIGDAEIDIHHPAVTVDGTFDAFVAHANRLLSQL